MIRPINPEALIYNATKRIEQLAEPKANKKRSKKTIDTVVSDFI